MKLTLFKISSSLNRKIIKLLLLFCLLFICLNFEVTAKEASSNDSFIPEKYSSEMDDYLKAYIKETIPNTSLWIDSDTKTNFIQNSPHYSSEKINLNDSINGTVYTFVCEDDDEPVYYTVLDFYFTKKLKTSKSDLLELSMNDYLRPVSPGKGILLVKDRADEDWMMKDDIYVIVNLSFASVYGDQIYNNQNYSRVIMSFSSFGNPNPEYIMPEYVINYAHQKESALTFVIFGVVLITVTFLFITLLYYKHLKNIKEANVNKSFLN